MSIRFDRIEKGQALMRKQGWAGIMIMNHDDYRYFFGRDWAQPRAIIPREGAPVLISFTSEEPELREYARGSDVKVFTHVGEQMAALPMGSATITSTGSRMALGCGSRKHRPRRS
jgi:Xaa-Pro aminopeptidase